MMTILNPGRAVSLTMLLAFALLSCDGRAGVAGIIAKLPVQTASERDEISRTLLTHGADAIRELTRMLVAPGAGDDKKARTALAGLAIYATRAGGDADRKIYTQVLSEALSSGLAPQAKTFLIEQLCITGGEDIVAPLGNLLRDTELCEPAAQTLLSLHHDSVPALFRKALPEAQGPARATIIKALGSLRDRDAAPALMKDATNVDAAVRIAALFALANIGDPAASGVLSKAASGANEAERAQATLAYIRLAERLAEDKNVDSAVKICRELLQTRTDARDQHVVCAALVPLVQVLGPAAFDDLLSALKSDRYQLRAVAKKLALSLPGEAVTRRWVEQLKPVSSEVRVEILSILAQRKDRIAFPAAIEASKDSEKAVRLAAIGALALGQSDAVAPLVAILEKGGPDEQAAARNVLAQLDGGDTNSKLAAAAANSPLEVRKALIFVLGAREARGNIDVVLAAAKDSDESLRIEALNALAAMADGAHVPALLEFIIKSTAREQGAAEKALAAACQRADDPAKASAPVLAAAGGAEASVRSGLLRVLRRVGGPGSLPAFRAAMKQENADLVDVAVRELSEWPDESAAGDLLALARETKKDNHNVLALRGYIRLAGLSSRKSDDAFKMYRSALEVARRADEKKLVLAALGATKDSGALKLLDPFFEDAALKEEAVTAVVNIAKAAWKRDSAPVRAALNKVLAATKNERLKKDSEDLLKRMGN